MKIIFVLAISLLAIGIKAQDTNKVFLGIKLSEPLKESSDTSALYKVERESEYPGGITAWNNFLQRMMRYPDMAFKNRIEGTVRVQFIVDKDGKVSNIHAISGPEEGGLREEAERVIRRSGKWIPAFQYGKYVKSYKMQPFIFRL
jgi:protein TonB